WIGGPVCVATKKEPTHGSSYSIEGFGDHGPSEAAAGQQLWGALGVGRGGSQWLSVRRVETRRSRRKDPGPRSAERLHSRNWPEGARLGGPTSNLGNDGQTYD